EALIWPNPVPVQQTPQRLAVSQVHRFVLLCDRLVGFGLSLGQQVHPWVTCMRQQRVHIHATWPLTPPMCLLWPRIASLPRLPLRAFAPGSLRPLVTRHVSPRRDDDSASVGGCPLGIDRRSAAPT